MRYIKTILACLTIIGSLLSFTALASSELKGYAAKEQEIQKQIDYATQHGNHHWLSGLEKALNEIRQHCTDEKLTLKRKH